MKKLQNGIWSWPLTVPIVLGLFSLWLVLMLFTVGCKTDPASLDKYQTQYQAATNTLNIVHTAVQPYVPAPVSGVTEGVFAIVTAVLAAWNTWQHRQIAALQKNQQAPNGSSLAPAAPPSS